MDANIQYLHLEYPRAIEAHPVEILAHGKIRAHVRLLYTLDKDSTAVQVETKEDFEEAMIKVFNASPTHEVLIEES